jgi:hypothetical protein
MLFALPLDTQDKTNAFIDAMHDHSGYRSDALGQDATVNGNDLRDINDGRLHKAGFRFAGADISWSIGKR